MGKMQLEAFGVRNKDEVQSMLALQQASEESRAGGIHDVNDTAGNARMIQTVVNDDLDDSDVPLIPP